MPLAPEARLRGAAAGALTAALSPASHAIAGGGPPSGSAATLVLVVAVTVGALVSTTGRRSGTTQDLGTLVALLALGQALGHTVLSTVGHAHGHATPVPWALMLGAHLVAVSVGAGLIATGGYLCGALSRVVRAVAPHPRLPVPAAAPARVAGADQPLRSALLLAVSVSHRGPPVGSLH